MNKLIFAAAIAAVTSLTTAIPSSALACSIDDIKVKQATLDESSSDMRYIVGEVYNGCADAIGVQVQVVLRDTVGQIVSVDKFWLSGMRDIPPHSMFPFQGVAGHPNPKHPEIGGMDFSVVGIGVGIGVVGAK